MTYCPVGFFLTKIFHPNVAQNGAICVNTLKRDWKPEHGIKHILLVSNACLSLCGQFSLFCNMGHLFCEGLVVQCSII